MEASEQTDVSSTEAYELQMTNDDQRTNNAERQDVGEDAVAALPQFFEIEEDGTMRVALSAAANLSCYDSLPWRHPWSTDPDTLTDHNLWGLIMESYNQAVFSGVIDFVRPLSGQFCYNFKTLNKLF